MPDESGKTELSPQPGDADGTVRAKRRRSSRAKRRATSQPKSLSKRPKSPKAAAKTRAPKPPVSKLSAPDTSASRNPVAGPIAAGLAAPIAAAVVTAEILVPFRHVVEAHTQTGLGADTAIPPDASPDIDHAAGAAGSDFQPTPAIVPSTICEFEESRSIERAEGLESVPPASGSRRTRWPVVRWATAASIALACPLALGRYSDAHLSALGVRGSIDVVRAAVQAVAPAKSATGTGTPPMQLAALVLPSSDTPSIVPPVVEAPLDTKSLAATLGPSASERILARDAASIDAAGRRPANPRRAARTGAVASNGAPSLQAASAAEQSPTRLAGRAHTPGTYNLRWGTARLHEDPNSESAQGPIWDFVANGLPR